MSKRKRYRRLRNEAVKNNLREFSKHRREKHEEREASDAKEQLGRARLMYETFKSELTSEARTAPQVIADFEAFKDVIKKIVKHEHTRRVILDEINFAQLKFIAAYGPKGQAQVKQWETEAKKLRVSNRITLPPDDRDGGADLSRN